MWVEQEQQRKQTRWSGTFCSSVRIGKTDVHLLTPPRRITIDRE
jgi:hypothetical protein